MVVLIFVLGLCCQIAAAAAESIDTFPALITACGTSGPQKTISLKDPVTGEEKEHNCIEAMVYGCSVFCTEGQCKGNTTLQGSCLSYCPNAKETCLVGDIKADDESLANDLKRADAPSLTDDIMANRNEKEESAAKDGLGDDILKASHQGNVEEEEAETSEDTHEASSNKSEKDVSDEEDQRKGEEYWQPSSKPHKETLVDEEHDTSDNHPPQEPEPAAEEKNPEEEPQEDEGEVPTDDAADLKGDDAEDKGNSAEEKSASGAGSDTGKGEEAGATSGEEESPSQDQGETDEGTAANPEKK